MRRRGFFTKLLLGAVAAPSVVQSEEILTLDEMLARDFERVVGVPPSEYKGGRKPISNRFASPDEVHQSMINDLDTLHGNR